MYSRSLVWQTATFSLKNFFKLLFLVLDPIIFTLIIFAVSAGCIGLFIYGILAYIIQLNAEQLAASVNILKTIFYMLSHAYISYPFFRTLIRFNRNQETDKIAWPPFLTIVSLAALEYAWETLLDLPYSLITSNSIFLRTLTITIASAPFLIISLRLSLAPCCMIDGKNIFKAITTSWKLTHPAQKDIIKIGLTSAVLILALTVGNIFLVPRINFGTNLFTFIYFVIYAILFVFNKAFKFFLAKMYVELDGTTE